MTNICERLLVRRPECDASHYLAAFAAQHRGGAGSMRFALRLPIKMFSAWTIPIERHGVASFYSLQSSNDRHATYSITWSAKTGAPIPEFAGALAVEKVADIGSFGLVLSGHYEPPLGKAGVLFDAVVGRRMAHGFAQDLLRAIAAHVQTSSPAIDVLVNGAVRHAAADGADMVAVASLPT